MACNESRFRMWDLFNFFQHSLPAKDMRRHSFLSFTHNIRILESKEFHFQVLGLEESLFIPLPPLSLYGKN